MDFNVGEPLSKDKTWTYNVGGFYRNADGAKYPGYTLSYGGQVKANVVKNYKSGQLKFYVKILDDNTAPFEFTPTVDFQNPRPAGSFTNTSSTLIQSQQFVIPKAISGASKDILYDTRKVQAFNERAFGLTWEQTLGEGWTFNNNLKLAYKDFVSQTTSVVFPFRVDQMTFYGVSGNVARFGTYEFLTLLPSKAMAQYNSCHQPVVEYGSLLIIYHYQEAQYCLMPFTTTLIHTTSQR
jgi:hypothetical protein